MRKKFTKILARHLGRTMAKHCGLYGTRRALSWSYMMDLSSILKRLGQ